jgi:isopenicillin-N epimerase
MQQNHRRKFMGQLIAGSIAGLAFPLSVEAQEPMPSWTNAYDEAYWEKIKEQFAVPDNLRMMNAANLCPGPLVVHERVIELTRQLNKDVSFQYRSVFSQLRKKSLGMLAKFIGAGEEEIGITRNTSESNCMIAHGLDLKPGDEVVVWDQNHPSNREIWTSQAKRLGFTVISVKLPENPSSTKDLIEPFGKVITSATKLIAFSHISNLSGIALPAKEICEMANAKGIMTLVDGAQSLGLMPIDLHDMGCSFYTSSTHKWLMGPFENGVLYVNKAYFSRLWPNVIGGGWKEAKTVDENLCVLGQRNEPSVAALPEILAFHSTIGSENIKKRVEQLCTYLKTQISSTIPFATFVTPLAPELSGGIVIINFPGKDARELTEKLYQSYGIATAPAGGIRLSPHIYNILKDIDYTVKALASLAK